MKTVMNELLELLEKEIKSITIYDGKGDKYYQEGLKHAYNLAKEKLPKERKQINEAVEYGFIDANRPNPDQKFEDYYTQQYGKI